MHPPKVCTWHVAARLPCYLCHAPIELSNPCLPKTRLPDWVIGSPIQQLVGTMVFSAIQCQEQVTRTLCREHAATGCHRAFGVLDMS